MELSPPPSPFDSYGRTLKFVTADPSTPGEIYVGQVQEIAHSRDGGESWEQLKLPWSYVTALSIDPRNSDVLYAATGIGIMKSANRGRSWSLKKELDQTGELVKTKIVISRSNPSVLYAFTRFFGPIDRSTDGGETWTTVLLGAELTDLAVGARNPDSLFGSTLRDGVFRSSDGGVSWQQIGAGLPEGEQIRSIAVDDGGAFVHAGTWSHGVWEWPLSQRRRPVSRP